MQNFHDTLNPLCSHSLEPQTISHYLLRCHNLDLMDHSSKDLTYMYGLYIFFTHAVSCKHVICGVQMRFTTSKQNYHNRTAPTKNGLSILLLTQINIFLLVFLLWKWLQGGAACPAH